MKLQRKMAAVALATAVVASAAPVMTTLAATSTSPSSTRDMVYGDKFSYPFTNVMTTAPAIELSMKNTANVINVGSGLSFLIDGSDVSFSNELYSNTEIYAVDNFGNYIKDEAGNYVIASHVNIVDVEGYGDTPTVTLNIDGHSRAFIVRNGIYFQFIQGSDGVWREDFRIARNNNTQLTVTLFQNFDRDAFLTLPLAMQVTGTNPAVSITGGGGISSQTEIKLSSNSDVSRYNTSISIGAQGYLSTEGHGTLGSIRFQENKAGAFAQTTSTAVNESGHPEIGQVKGAGVNYLVQLKNSRLEWDLNEGDYLYLGSAVDNSNLIPGARDLTNSHYVGFTGGLASVTDYLAVQVIAIDEEEMVINILDTSNSDRSLKGYVELANLPVNLKSRTSDLSLGDLEVEVTEVELSKTKLPTGVVGHDISDFTSSRSVSIRDVIAKVVDDHVVFQAYNEIELIAGQDTMAAEISLHEIIDGAINARDVFYLTLDKGYFVVDDIESVEFEFDGAIIHNDGNILTVSDEDDADEVVLDIAALISAAQQRGVITSSTNTAQYTEDVHRMLDNLYFELEIGANVDETGDIYLGIESRNLDDDLLLFLGTSEAAFTVAWDKVNVELGVKSQTHGTIVITETDEEMFRDGSQIIIDIEDSNQAIKIQDVDFEVDSSSGIEVDVEVKDGMIIITIEEESMSGPGTITLSNIEYDVWGGTPRGSYDMYIGGSAVDFSNAKYGTNVEYSDMFNKYKEVDNYLVVGNDIYAEQLVAQVNFATGTASVNDSFVELVAQPFLSDSGRTMVGVRDLATFFNIHEDNILFSSGGHVTIKNGDNLISLTNGSNIIYKNGQPIYADEAMQIVNDRSYAPAKYIALALGLNVEFNDVDKTATFSN
ncbi:MAG: hypothetical protein BEN18_10085 [Epulopiscium sp. Nuni2H_MBin001]|nr:MAG: hypothetical protein BEN18_10085 [Epulopiscium sp. Nuni2H_MBin001]